jgi:murein DD-endopeptidase MepM/ murein hydrolase activator NlpD
MKKFVIFLSFFSLSFIKSTSFEDDAVFYSLFKKSNYSFIKMYDILRDSETISYITYIKTNIPSVLPCKKARITSYYGYRLHPIQGGVKYHCGIDLVSNESDDIFSVIEGTITYKGYKGGYGNCIKIKNEWGFEVLYGHLDSFREEMEVGDYIYQNEFIGIMGSTGSVTEKHLHYEIKYKEVRINPKDNLEFIQMLYKLQNEKK